MASNHNELKRRTLWNFAPFPISALRDTGLTKKERQLLLYLLALRSFLGMKDVFTITDCEILRELHTAKGEHFPDCGLSRNTMKSARKTLIETGYITVENLGKDNDRALRRYVLTAGKAIPYAQKLCQEMTPAVSTIDPLYKEENKDNSKTPARRDRKERRTRELSDERQTSQQRLMALIAELYPQYNRGHLPIPNPSKAHAAMRRFLLDNPDYPEDALALAILHRYISQGRLQAPDRWIPNLAEYIDAPLDRYGQPLTRYVLPKSPATAGVASKQSVLWAATEQGPGVIM